MGIGMNFVCSHCDYDTGILMLNQGLYHDIPAIIHKYLYTYTQETDIKMLPKRARQYMALLGDHQVRDAIHHYYGCVCYHCNRTYEILDILRKKEEGVLAGECRSHRQTHSVLEEMFLLPRDKWSSLIGEDTLCIFCDHQVRKITGDNLRIGIPCPKCRDGMLQTGEEFQLWE